MEVNNVQSKDIKSFGILLGEWMKCHPWMTFFITMEAITAPAAIIRAVKGTDVTTKETITVSKPEQSE